MPKDDLALSIKECLLLALKEAYVGDDIVLPQDIQDHCRSLVIGGKETARLVALTNVAGTAVDQSIEANILQVQHGGVDFRSLYKRSTQQVLIDMAKEAEVKWSPSADPYVSNPYREDSIDDEWVARRNNKLPGAEQLNEIVKSVTRSPDIAHAVLVCLLRYELERLQSQKIEYAIPPRLTVQAASGLLSAWLDDGAGGARLEIAAVAILRHVGTSLGRTWSEVTSHHVNDPIPHDALCMSGRDVHTVVEVKDQKITMPHITNLSDQMVEHKAQRGLLLTRRRWFPVGELAKKITDYLLDRNQYGLRIQILDVNEALNNWLPLIDADDDALPRFLSELTSELDAHGQLEDRTSLAGILREI